MNYSKPIFETENHRSLAILAFGDASREDDARQAVIIGYRPIRAEMERLTTSYQLQLEHPSRADELLNRLAERTDENVHPYRQAASTVDAWFETVTDGPSSSVVDAATVETYLREARKLHAFLFDLGRWPGAHAEPGDAVSSPHA